MEKKIIFSRSEWVRCRDDYTFVVDEERIQEFLDYYGIINLTPEQVYDLLSDEKLDYDEIQCTRVVHEKGKDDFEEECNLYNLFIEYCEDSFYECGEVEQHIDVDVYDFEQELIFRKK